MTEVLEVDVSNPGQVLACLGLLEVLDLMWPGSAGAFFSEKEFHIESGATITSVLTSLHGATIE